MALRQLPQEIDPFLHQLQVLRAGQVPLNAQQHIQPALRTVQLMLIQVGQPMGYQCHRIFLHRLGLRGEQFRLRKFQIVQVLGR